MLIGKRIKAQRARKNITQEELAKILGVSSSTVAMWEVDRRDPDTTTLKKLAEVLDCSTDYLLGRVNKPYYEVFEDLPQELRDEGVKMLLLTKEAARDGLTAEDLADILDFVRNQKKKK